jgi:hypothetical protein
MAILVFVHFPRFSWLEFSRLVMSQRRVTQHHHAVTPAALGNEVGAVK